MPRWATSARNQRPRPTQPEPAFCAGWNEYIPGESRGSKQAYRVTHQPVSVVSQCSLIAWLNGLASGDQRRLTGSGSALEACSRRCAVQMAALTLIYLLTYCCDRKRSTFVQRNHRKRCVSSQWRVHHQDCKRKNS